jgi:glycosyltransferase involved in cell wall biosynthesis
MQACYNAYSLYRNETGSARMKVLFLCDFGSAHGGAEIATLSLRDGLRERGHDARLLSSSARPSDLPILADYVCHGSVGFSQVYLQTANPWAWSKVGQVLREFRPDVVHVSMLLLELSPLILPLLGGTPAVYHAHWLRSVCPTGMKLLPDRSLCHHVPGAICRKTGCVSAPDWPFYMAQRNLWKLWRRVFRRVVAPSESIRKTLLEDGIDNVEVIPNGIAPKPQRGARSDPPAVLFCGRLVKEKGIDVLLRAWTGIIEEIPEAQLYIAGEGPDRPNLERIERRNVHFLGHVSQSDLDGVAAPCWVQVVPSVCIESFSLAALEGMMRGMGVVASDVGGIPDLIDNGSTGLLVPRGDVAALRSAVLLLLSDPFLCEEIGQRARAKAEITFSRDRYLLCFENLYKELMSGGDRAA